MAKFVEESVENSISLRSFVSTLGSYYTVGLYLLFSIVDFVFFSDFFSEFFAVRILVVVSIFFVNKKLKSIPDSNFNLIQKVASLPFVACSMSINYMIIRIPDLTMPYWAGLAILISALSVGFRFDWKYYFLNLFAIILPFMSFSVIRFLESDQIAILLYSIFLLSITVVCFSGRWFYQKISHAEYSNRKKLAEELTNRNKIIEEKTIESVRLNSLNKQFSPQIVDSIRTGKISLNSKIHRSEICALFVDIKDSTSKFSTLDRDHLQKIIAMYIDDVMGIFLKYDITIDKFLGDGVMGFSNDPVSQSDYLERVILAAIEIKNKIFLKRDVYAKLWGSDFEIRLGISSGYASIGFYGSDHHVKSYTAIGRVINLASRVNGAACANQIAVSEEVIEKLTLKNSKFFNDINLTEIPQQSLKGFENEKIKLYSVDKSVVRATEPSNESCPFGHGPLVLEQNRLGIYILKCRYCDYVLQADSVYPNAS